MKTHVLTSVLDDALFYCNFTKTRRKSNDLYQS
nr:MAG TPA: hypothetical protein [Caudoviricetes sp.]